MIRSRMKEVLAKRNMSQLQLVKLTGIRQPTISALCLDQAKHIPINGMDKICHALDCQPGDLFEYIPDREQNQDDKKPQA